MVGEHTSIEKTRNLIDMVADTGFNVLITGETGTGKEVVARLLHERSPRSKKRFVKVNCGALPGTLLESELFGYEKGAFTGADHRKLGKFQVASGGVIFLDEIGDMSKDLQAKILEVLQSATFHPLGGKREIKADAWVIASTNRNLEEDVKAGLFREDLYYRLNVIKIELLPLRERNDDIPLLIDHFVNLHSELIDTEEPFSIPEPLKTLFQEYNWPGNVRELANMVLRLLCGEKPVEIKEDIVRSLELDRELSTENASSKIGETGHDSIVPLKTLKAQAEKAIQIRAIRFALQASNGNKRQAARVLGISYKTLYNKLDILGLS
ncbi:MAG: sigma-54 dependent transcriptional regulator [Desulfovermiculus sp.]